MNLSDEFMANATLIMDMPIEASTVKSISLASGLLSIYIIVFSDDAKKSFDFSITKFFGLLLFNFSMAIYFQS